MSKTLSEILTDVNAFVDLTAELPTGDELTTRVDYANQAVWDASATAQLHEFDGVYEVNPGTASAITLPSNFREFKTNPYQDTGSTWVEFPEIFPDEKYTAIRGSNYCYVTGNPSAGYIATFSNLTANLTLSFTYQRYPSGLATLTDVCELSDPTFVTAKTESYVLQARGDDRFPFVDAIAERKLKNMVGRDMKSPGGQRRTTPSGFKNPLS